MKNLVIRCTFIRGRGHNRYTKVLEQPRTMNTISNGKFAGYPDLSSIEIPKGITAIGLNAFARCSQLRKVTLHDGIEAIHAGAFEDCVSLEEIIIPRTVKNIGCEAFKGCTGLKVAKICSLDTHIHKAAFDEGVEIQYIAA